MIDWTQVSHYVPEIILVVLFMVYEERRKREQDKQDLARDEVWRLFLVEEREERHRANENMSSILSALVTGVSGNHELLITHDKWERERQAQEDQGRRYSHEREAKG